MLTAILSPVAFTSNLAIGLRKIARTPTARLAVGYHLVPRIAACLPIVSRAHDHGARRPPQADPGRFIAFLGRRADHAQFQLQRKLGEELNVQRIVAGGIVGEILPLSVRRACDNRNPVGQLLDVVA